MPNPKKISKEEGKSDLDKLFCNAENFRTFESFQQMLDSDRCLRDCRYRDFFIGLCTNHVKDHPSWEVDEVSYKLFLKEIRRIQTILGLSSYSHEEEHSLVKSKCNGNAEAFVKLFFSQMKLVLSTARKYQNRGLPLNDLVSEGYVGLWKALEKIEPSPFRVSSYVIYSIKANIENAIVKYGTQIRYQTKNLSDIYKIQTATDNWLVRNGILPSTEEIAEICSINVYEVEETISLIHTEISIEKLKSCFQDHDLFDEFMDHSSVPEPSSEELYSESLNKDIERTLRKLYPKEREIIKL